MCLWGKKTLGHPSGLILNLHEAGNKNINLFGLIKEVRVAVVFVGEKMFIK